VGYLRAGEDRQSAEHMNFVTVGKDKKQAQDKQRKKGRISNTTGGGGEEQKKRV